MRDYAGAWFDFCGGPAGAVRLFRRNYKFIFLKDSKKAV